MSASLQKIVATREPYVRHEHHVIEKDYILKCTVKYDNCHLGYPIEHSDVLHMRIICDYVALLIYTPFIAYLETRPRFHQEQNDS